MSAVLGVVKRKCSETVSAVKKFRVDKFLLLDLLLIAALWFVIFDPPFMIGFNVLHIFGGASLLFLLFKRRYWMPLIKFELILAALFVYIAVVSLLNGVALFDILSSSVVYWMIDIVPIAFVFVDICKIRKYDYEDFEKLIIGAGVVFTVIGISAILSTALHDAYYNYLADAGVIKNSSLYVRTYGFASNLLYSSPIACAVIGVMCMRRFALRNKFYYLLLSVAMMAVSYYNGRVSLFVYAAGCLAVFITYKKHRLKLFVTGASLLAVVIIAFLVLRSYVFSEKSPDKHLLWLYAGLSNIFGRFFGETEQTKYHYNAFNYYINPVNYPYPGNIVNLLFGTGETILSENSYGVYTDIGFVNDVWYGGFVYVAAVYTAIIAFCRKFKEKLVDSTDDKLVGSFLSALFVFTFLIGNLKGIFITFNNATTVFWLLFVFSVLRNKELSPDDFPLFKKKKVN